MSASRILLGGAAHRVTNHDLGTDIQGAGCMQKAAAQRDDLEANVLYLADGDERVLLIGLDLVALCPPDSLRLRQAIAAATGLPLLSILLTGTHMHSGPSVIPTCYGKPVDQGYLAKLADWLPPLARQAVDAAQPVRIGIGAGAVRIGYNRRCCWADGSHTMHGNTARPDFTGLEGPDDPAHTVLAIEALDGGRPLAIWYCNTTHPTCYYGRDFFSADFPGKVRADLRAALDPGLTVLFFNGAFGDISIGNMRAGHAGSNGGDSAVNRVAHQITGETLRLFYDMAWAEHQVIRQTHAEIEVAVRLPTPERLVAARALLDRIDAGETGIKSMDTIMAFGSLRLQDDFGARPVDRLGLWALRIGPLAIATNPCELYCQYGLDIKRRSPAPITVSCGQVNGYHGYCPTPYGPLGGGYSGEPIWWTRLEVAAGDRIVDANSRMLRQLWQEP